MDSSLALKVSKMADYLVGDSVCTYIALALWSGSYGGGESLGTRLVELTLAVYFVIFFCVNCVIFQSLSLSSYTIPTFRSLNASLLGLTSSE